MLRHAIEEPTQRATFAAVFNIFAFIDVPIVYLSIRLFRTQHPGPVFFSSNGSFPPDWSAIFGLNLLALMMLSSVMIYAARLAPGRDAPRNRIPDAPHRARVLDGLYAPYASFFSPLHSRTPARLQRNYEFLSYGLIAAWVILVVYVLMMTNRQKKLKREIATLKAMLEDKNK